MAKFFKESLYNRLRSYTNAKIFNGYGPSECTACSSNKEIVENSNITIGKPFLNTRIYILNDDLNMLPIGYNGEMYISGDGVGKGYINRNDITSKAFIKDIYSNNIMYKTGDIGKYQSNGDLIYIGRKDSQIKLRVFRIELDEITNRLVKINNIINAVSVIKKVNNIDCICSYVVTKGQISEQEIKNIFKKQSPILYDTFSYHFYGRITYYIKWKNRHKTSSRYKNRRKYIHSSFYSNRIKTI